MFCTKNRTQNVRTPSCSVLKIEHNIKGFPVFCTKNRTQN